MNQSNTYLMISHIKKWDELMLKLYKQLKDLILYGTLCLFASSAACFLLGLIFIVSVAGIELIGVNEPPIRWKYIYAGLYNIFCSALGISSAILNYIRPRSIMPVIGTFFMISGGMLEIPTEEYNFCILIPLICALYLTIRFKIGLIRYKIEMLSKKT